MLSRIEEEIGGRRSPSGSLVDLLEDQHLSAVSTSGVKLRRPKEKPPIWPWILAAAAVLLVLALLLAIALARSATP